MQAEERIKELIIAKYGNVRAFATESGISYTTVRSILERGIMNAKAENVFQVTFNCFSNHQSYPTMLSFLDVCTKVRVQVVLYSTQE